MGMCLWRRYAKSDRDHIKERRLGQGHAAARKLGAGSKPQIVAPDGHRAALDQRPIRATLLIGKCLDDVPASAVSRQLDQFQRHADRGLTGERVEDMRRQPAIGR
jgi:hypothetical protein